MAGASADQNETKTMRFTGDGLNGSAPVWYDDPPAVIPVHF